MSLFLPGIKASFALGDASVALIFTAATLASALALWRIGARIDRADVVGYAVACGAFLAVACFVIAAAQHFLVLVLGMFCLRLAGNGLLTHVAVTATARYFTNDRGQALALVLLGSAIGEGALPALIVTLIGAWGWRAALALSGLLGCVLVIVAVALVWTNAAFRVVHARPLEAAVVPLAHESTRQRPGALRFWWFTAPLFVAMPLIGTATVFHQALIAADKGLSLQWFAVSFIAFAVSRVASSVLTGPVVDRVGSAWPFALHVLPLALGTAALVAFEAPWVAPLYWFCAGVTAGVAGVVQTTLVAERVPLARLGAARSILAALTIMASALGPSLYGAALAAGARISTMLAVSAVLLAVATALGGAAIRMDARQRTVGARAAGPQLSSREGRWWRR